MFRLILILITVLLAKHTLQAQVRPGYRGKWLQTRWETIHSDGKTTERKDQVWEFEFLEPNAFILRWWSADPLTGEQRSAARTEQGTFQYWRDTLVIQGDQYQRKVYRVVSRSDTEMVWLASGALEHRYTFKRVR
jgi:hypothetical protein